MVILLWWLGAILVVAAVAAFLLGRRRRTRNDPERGAALVVANAEYVTALAPYKRWLAQYKALRFFFALFIVVALITAIVMAARPATRTSTSPQMRNRDIVLCLDVSRSMTPYDTQIIERFSEMVKTFDGERVALSIWNSTSRIVFPLTDDYGLIEDELDFAAYALDFDYEAWNLGTKQYSRQKVDDYLNFLDGTLGIDRAASLIGDGLASCAIQFDQGESERSRSIILATDNEENDDPADPKAIYTLPEATQIVQERDIKLYSLYAEAGNDEAKQSYEDATTAIGGMFYTSTDPDAARGIVDDIARQQAVAMDATPVVHDSENPMPGFIIALIAVAGVIFVAWRLHE